MADLEGFHDVRFPESITYGSSGGPRFKTAVMELSSGFEKRNQEWSRERAEYEVSHLIKTRAQMEELIHFFYGRRGRAYGFRFKDWADFRVGFQILGSGDGVSRAFQIVKVYSPNYNPYTRVISKPVQGTCGGAMIGRIVNGTFEPYQVLSETDHFVIDYSTGILTTHNPVPAGQLLALTSIEFDVPVRFDIDQMKVEHDAWETMSWPQIPLIEVRIRA